MWKRENPTNDKICTKSIERRDKICAKNVEGAIVRDAFYDQRRLEGKNKNKKTKHTGNFFFNILVFIKN